MRRFPRKLPASEWLDVAWIGRTVAPPLALGVYFLLPAGETGLTGAGRATASVVCLMAVLWLTEAMPLAVTALLPVVLFPLLGVATIRDAAAPYAREYVFLFMGGFMLALAMQRWNLHRRIALIVVLAVGTSPARLVGGMMLASALLSLWISNTATTVMMLPIGLSLVAILTGQLGSTGPARFPDSSDPPLPPDPSEANFPTCLMLGIAYAASIGGMGTLIGTPPNLVLAGFVWETFSLKIGFARWMAVALPLVAVFLLVAWGVLTKLVFPVGTATVPGGRRLIRAELAKLGPVARGERTVLAVFTLTALAWIVREPLTYWPWLVRQVPALTRLDDAGIALAAAIALFAIPVDARKGVFALDWQTAKKLPWEILLLFGGGLSLAAAVQSSGLTEWIGYQVAALKDLPPLALVVLVVLTVTLLTEMTSNVATTSAFLPILGGVAVGIGVEPLRLLVPATLAASCAFMMPVATPPNALVFGSGHVTIRQMVRAGIWLNLIGLALVTLLARYGVPWLLTSAPVK